MEKGNRVQSSSMCCMAGVNTPTFCMTASHLSQLSWEYQAMCILAREPNPELPDWIEFSKKENLYVHVQKLE